MTTNWLAVSWALKLQLFLSMLGQCVPSNGSRRSFVRWRLKWAMERERDGLREDERERKKERKRKRKRKRKRERERKRERWIGVAMIDDWVGRWSSIVDGWEGWSRGEDEEEREVGGKAPTWKSPVGGFQSMFFFFFMGIYLNNPPPPKKKKI